MKSWLKIPLPANPVRNVFLLLTQGLRRASYSFVPTESQPTPKPAQNIQEILRNRREMLNRVRADLNTVAKLQGEFFKPRPFDEGIDKKNPSPSCAPRRIG